MKLDKKVCRQCIANFYGATDWLPQDNKNWLGGTVMCPEFFEQQDVNKPPQEHCKFALEHLMADKAKT